MNEIKEAKEIINCGRIAKDTIPWLSLDELSRYIRESVRNGQRVSAFFGIPSADGEVWKFMLCWQMMPRAGFGSAVVP
jgi:hypothetical protein